MLPTVVGSPSECAEQMHDLTHRYRVDEVMFMDASSSLAERSRTCELLAGAIGLTAEPLAA
jgi:alkanesulfonate monooxygenase SsuD/methylene tetrahydromethanopterin reductase-like flavin-dependent oxidoreductase (luciferase family)